MSELTKKEIYLFQKYPLTELKRLVDEAINKGSDDFSIESEDGYGNDVDFYLKTYKREY